MNKVLQALTSRTVWTGIVMVLVNGIPAIKGMIPANLLPVVDSVLGLLAIYFRINIRANLD